jgi:hypothetical protein
LDHGPWESNRMMNSPKENIHTSTIHYNILDVESLRHWGSKFRMLGLQPLHWLTASRFYHCSGGPLGLCGKQESNILHGLLCLWLLGVRIWLGSLERWFSHIKYRHYYSAVGLLLGF